MKRTRYDAVVVGGGVAAVFHACALAEQGHSVALACSGTSLAHEIGLTRMPVKGIRELGSRFPLVHSWLEGLAHCGALMGDRMEPVWTQLLADQFAAERGVDVLFEAFPAGLVLKGEGDGSRVVGVRLATREGIRIIESATVADCTETAVLARELLDMRSVDPADRHALWTMTVLRPDLITEEGDQGLHNMGTPRLEQERFSFDLDGAHVDCEIHPAFRNEECSVLAIVSSPEGLAGSEIGFTAILEQVYAQIKRHSPTQIGPLLHVSEKCWTTPGYVCTGPPQGRMNRRTDVWLESADGSFSAIGCWTGESRYAIAMHDVYEMGGASLRLLVEAAMEAAEKKAGSGSLQSKNG
ncbi:FAD-dependent oxidoreductase [Paenibacillus oryzisoli]|uniref:FAD-dependent oxidoreductase n=1 Tax=Paenibacillus oryzisoli TaxID=1850517 RepID=UPI003D27CC25